MINIFIIKMYNNIFIKFKKRKISHFTTTAFSHAHVLPCGEFAYLYLLFTRTNASYSGGCLPSHTHSSLDISESCVWSSLLHLVSAGEKSLQGWEWRREAVTRRRLRARWSWSSLPHGSLPRYAPSLSSSPSSSSASSTASERSLLFLPSSHSFPLRKRPCIARFCGSFQVLKRKNQKPLFEALQKVKEGALRLYSLLVSLDLFGSSYSINR